MKTAILLTLGVTLLLPVAFGGPKITAPNQEPPARARTTDELHLRKVSFDFKGNSLRDALKALFKRVPTNYFYALDPIPTGDITFSVKDVPFEGALVCILGSMEKARFAYRETDNTLVITPSEETGRAATDKRRFFVDFKDVNLRQAIGILFRTCRVNYVMDQDVQGMVTLRLEEAPLQTVLDKLLAQSKTPLSLRVEQDVYHIGPP